MTDVERLLAAELEELGRSAPHDADLARSVRRRARHRRTAWAAAVAVLVLIGGIAAAATRSRGGAAPVAAAPATAPAAAPPTFACAAPEPRLLPAWARTGFSDPKPVMPFVQSRDGRMVAILFTDRLTAPPRRNVGNKILWVTPVNDAGGFSFTARLSGTRTSVRRDVAPAPGPSIIDLPAPGCWQLELHWGGHYTDTIALPYTTP
jgi:hypothetical protein